MSILATWALMAAAALPLAADSIAYRRIDVDCASPLALERALARARRLGEVDIYLHGTCRGHYVIAFDGVTLRAGTAGAGLASPEPDLFLPVLEIVDAEASVRGLIVEGDVLGILIEGSKSEVLLYEVDVHGQADAGVIASRGARLRMIDSTVRDGAVGIVVESNSSLNFQNVVVDARTRGIVVSDRSSGAISDCTIRNNSESGLGVVRRSDLVVWDSTFSENGEVHAHASDWSSIRFPTASTIGSETDATPWALGVDDQSTIASFSTPVIHGDVYSIGGGSLQFGNTLLNGDLILWEYSNAIVRSSQINGIVECADGAEAICRNTTTLGAIDCPSPTCGVAPAAPTGTTPARREPPAPSVPSPWRPMRTAPAR